jgi:hypothetical protein
LQVDRVLHLPPRLLLPRLGVSSSGASWASKREAQVGAAPSPSS